MTPDAKIPEWIPTWVIPAPVTAPVTAAPATTSAVPTEGALDRGVRSLVRFFAKLLGKPDPITGQPIIAPATTTWPADKAANFADKIRLAANKAVNTATTVATQTVDATKATVNQAVEWVKDVKTDIDAASRPVAPATTQPLETLEKTQ